MTAAIADIVTAALRRIGVAVVADADRPALTSTFTLSDIATAALIELGVIASDETPSAADLALAQAKAAAIHDAMVVQGFVSWQSSLVPQSVVEAYTRLTAQVLASSFGKSADPAVTPLLEKRVRETAMMLGSLTLAKASVLAVHQNLTARGIARWSVFDIPDGAAEPYAMLAADDLAPQFERPRVPGDTQMANRTLAQITSLPSGGEPVMAAYF
jgi:hypothetical protein